MKPGAPQWALPCLCIALSGCGIGGFWMNGDPFYNPEIKPYIANWQKEGMTESGRREDSAECGASRSTAVADDVVFPTELLKAEQRQGDANELAAFWRLREKWSKCMESKGYRHNK